MTPEQIRAEAIERLARMQFELDEPGNGEQYEDWAPQYRHEVTKFVDALGDMLPTGIEWGAHNTSRDVVVVSGEAEAAVRQHAAAFPEPTTVVRRYRHDWREVTE